MDHDLRSRVASSLSGTYEVERELSGGGMSRIFVAEETALGRKVVVKVLPPDLAEAVSAERFIREIRVAARLQQANIVPVLRAGELDGIPYYTMPYVAGESLRASLTTGQIATPRALAILRDVAKALAYAHGEGVVHRDIKPENVLLSAGTAVVTDFGIAKAISDSRSQSGTGALTALGVSLGTPAYMAPEQAAGDPTTDARADLYAWGVTAYELLSGRHPFGDRTSIHELIRAHMTETPEHLAVRTTGLPMAVADLVMRCLAKSPADRPGSAGELLDVLDAAMAGGATATAPKPALGLWRALGVYACVFALVTVAARLSITLVGLPDWVFPSAIGVLALGLPVVLLTALIERQRSGMSSDLSRTIATLATRHPGRFTWRRTAVGGAATGALFIAGVGGYMALRNFGVGPFGSLIGAKAITARDRIVIADMRGPASDTALGSVFAEGMRVGLSESNAIRLVSTDAVKLALEQMRRPVAVLTPELARDIATRLGAKAVLDGDVRRVGEAAILTIRLNPVAGSDPLVTMQETARNDADFAAATGRLSRKLRARIGESLRRVNSAPPLEQVTTASLPALRKYTTAVQAANTGDYLLAIRSLGEAVAIDSEFVTAYSMLGSMISQISGTRQFQSEMLERAYDLRHRLPRSEQLRVEINYWRAGPTPDLAKAIAVAEAAPDQASTDIALTYGRLSDLYLRQHDYPASIAAARKAIAVESTFVEPLYDMARAFAELGDADSVQAALRRMAVLSPSHPLNPIMAYAVAVQRGQDSTAWQIARAMEGMTGNPFAAELGGYLHRALANRAGRLREAALADARAGKVALARGARMSVYNGATTRALDAALFLGDSAATVAILDSAVRAVPLDSIAPRDRRREPFGRAYALSHRPDRLRDLVKGQEHDDPASFDEAEVPVLPMLRAMLAETEGRYLDAIRYYREASTSGIPTSTFAPTAMAFLALGQKDSAITYFERYLGSSSINLNAFVDELWLALSRQRLAELYEERGQFDKAYALYAALVEQWRHADPELQPQVAKFRDRMRALERRKG